MNVNVMNASAAAEQVMSDMTDGNLSAADLIKIARWALVMMHTDCGVNDPRLVLARRLVCALDSHVHEIDTCFGRELEVGMTEKYFSEFKAAMAAIQ